jgi:hypothetical protein
MSFDIHQRSLNLIPQTVFSITHTSIDNSLIMWNIFPSSLYADVLLS